MAAEVVHRDHWEVVVVVAEPYMTNSFAVLLGKEEEVEAVVLLGRS